MAEVNKQKLIVSLSLAFVLSLAITILAVIAVGRLPSAPADMAEISRIFIVPASAFLPEPVERVQFLTGILLFPLLLGIYSWVIFRLLKGTGIRLGRSAPHILVAAAIIMVVSLMAADSFANGNFYLTRSLVVRLPWLAIPLIMLIVAMVFRSRSTSIKKTWPSKAAFLFTDCVVIGTAGFAGAINIFSSYVVTGSLVYVGHFNAIFYAASQVHAGKTILADLTHQYGLYPHFLEPVFWLTGLSVVKYTTLMGLLTAGCFLLLYIFLRRATKNIWVAAIGFMGLMYFTYFLYRSISGIDAYFQYVPIRFIFPVLLIALSFEYFRAKSKYLYVLVMAVVSIAVIWNLDTGIPVAITWVAALFYQEYLDRPPKKAAIASLRHLGALLFTAVPVGALFLVYLTARAGSFPDIMRTLSYQKYFFGSGFYMMPMNWFGPWNIVLLVYFLGLAYSLYALYGRESSPYPKTVFLLSVLGVGLFSYYQGRSHDMVLMNVWYPMWLLLPLFADRLLEASRSAPNRFSAAACVFVLVFLPVTAGAVSVPQAAVDCLPAAVFQATYKGNVPDGVDFIDRQSRSGEKIIVLSYNAGVYYAESRTESALSGPGLSELLLRTDLNAIISAIESKRTAKIFLDTDFINWDTANSKLMIEALENNYHATAASRGKGMKLYKPDN